MKRHTRIFLVVLWLLWLGFAFATRVDAAVTGISDDNLPLLTAQGHDIAASLPFQHGRLVIAYGSDYSSPAIRLWMEAAKSLHWSSMISIRRDTHSRAPRPTVYRRWLAGLLRKYPQVTVVEATNEPEITGLTPERAVALLRAARKAAPKRVRVLAGGFSDRSGYLKYVQEYSRRLGKWPTWAFHVYRGVVSGSMAYERSLQRASGAKNIWITETAAFTALGKASFTRNQQVAQSQRVLKLSEWPHVRRTYWQGLQACHGCQPKVSAPAHNFSAGPVLPYVQVRSTIVWDSYLMSTTGDVTTMRPGLEALLSDS